MELKEIFNNNNCNIYKVINFYETENIENWKIEETDYQLIPESNEDMYDAYFVIKAFVVTDDKVEDCFIDICIPERISEFIFRMVDNKLIFENTIEKKLTTVPAMASEQYGDSELYFIKQNPQIGIDILKKGIQISKNSSAINDDLTYIYEEIA
jgi:hypothetical protein